MSVTIPLPALAEWLRAELRDAAPGSVALLAGHYAIFTAGGAATDLLDTDPPPAGAPHDLLAFTRLTWRVACEAVAAEPLADAKLLVLVDDIQGVQPQIAEREQRERLGAALVARYFEETPMLPPHHLRVMLEHGLDARHVIPASAERWLFSERELRAQLVRHVSRRAQDGADGLSASSDGSMITVSHPEHGGYCLVHSGHTNCAGGYVELLAEAWRRGVRTLLAMVPMRCMGPVSVGTALMPALVDLPGFQVKNVAIQDEATGLGAVVG